MQQAEQRRSSRAHTGGAPPRGQRRQHTIRVPVQHYEVYQRLAAEAGVGLSDYLVAALAQANGLSVPEWARPRSAPEESLPMAG